MKNKEIEKILNNERFMREVVFKNKHDKLEKKIEEIDKVIEYIKKLEERILKHNNK